MAINHVQNINFYGMYMLNITESTLKYIVIRFDAQLRSARPPSTTTVDPISQSTEVCYLQLFPFIARYIYLNCCFVNYDVQEGQQSTYVVPSGFLRYSKRSRSSPDRYTPDQPKGNKVPAKVEKENKGAAKAEKGHKCAVKTEKVDKGAGKAEKGNKGGAKAEKGNKGAAKPEKGPKSDAKPDKKRTRRSNIDDWPNSAAKAVVPLQETTTFKGGFRPLMPADPAKRTAFIQAMDVAA